jgi:hypothetical protein
VRAEVAHEAIRLAHTLAVLQPDEPEVHGLLALCELTAARFPARTGPDGSPVLLEDQDRRRRDLSAIRRGLAARSIFSASGTVMSSASGTRPARAGRSAARRPTAMTWAPSCSTRSATRRPNPEVALVMSQASGGEPSGSKGLWGFCGPGEARMGSAIAPRAESEAVVRNQQPSSRARVVTQGE